MNIEHLGENMLNENFNISKSCINKNIDIYSHVFKMALPYFSPALTLFITMLYTVCMWLKRIVPLFSIT